MLARAEDLITMIAKDYCAAHGGTPMAASFDRAPPEIRRGHTAATTRRSALTPVRHFNEIGQTARPGMYGNVFTLDRSLP